MPFPSFTLTPSTGVANLPVGVVATGTATNWAGTTGFTLSGGTGASVSDVVVLSATQATFTLQPGGVAAVLGILDTTDGAVATFTVAAPSASGQTWSYDPSTPVGRVRLKAGDLDISNVGAGVARAAQSCFYTDQEIRVFLDDWAGDENFAAAFALRFVALRPELLAQRIQVQGLDTDVGDLAKRYNAAADAILAGRAMVPAEAIIEEDVGVFAGRRIIWNEILRTRGF